MAHSPYTGIMDCVRKTLQKDGVGAFFKSYKTTLVRAGVSFEIAWENSW